MEEVFKPSIELVNPEIKWKTNRPKDRILCVVNYGKPLVLDCIGPAVEYFQQEGFLDDTLENDLEPDANGVLIWEGSIECVRYLEGDFDEYLKGTTRSSTKEEWEAHLNGEYPWDPNEWKE